MAKDRHMKCLSKRGWKRREVPARSIIEKRVWILKK